MHWRRRNRESEVRNRARTFPSITILRSLSTEVAWNCVTDSRLPISSPLLHSSEQNRGVAGVVVSLVVIGRPAEDSAGHLGGLAAMDWRQRFVDGQTQIHAESALNECSR